MKFFDIHSHKLQYNTAAIVSVFEKFPHTPEAGYFSAGLHPWHLDNNTVATDWLSLQDVCKKKNILAIGECGLDKVCKTDWELQKEWFAKQIELANSLQKPLIIHCVRAFEEVILMLNKSKVSVPVIFHGFNKSTELSRKILAEGWYLSFGKNLIDNVAVQEVFTATPIDKLFLETDAAEIDIETIYRSAAKLREVDLKELAGQIEKNIIKVFGEKTISEHE